MKNEDKNSSVQSAGQLARHTLVYGVGSALTAAGGLILLPLYTHALTPVEYGQLEILNRVAEVAILLAFVGTRQAFIRFYFEKDDEDWRRSTTASVMVFVLFTTFAVSGIGATAIWVFGEKVEQAGLTTLTLYSLALWVPLEAMYSVSMTYLRVRLQSVFFIVLSAGRLVAFIVLNFVFLVLMDWGVAGVIGAQVIIVGLIALYFVPFFLKWTRLEWSSTTIREMVEFGLPYLPSAALIYFVLNADRFFLGALYSADDVGIFALGSKIGAVAIALFLAPIEMVWSPFVFSTYKRSEGAVRIGDAFTVYTMLSVLLAVGISLAGGTLIDVIASEEFSSASSVVPILALGSVFYGMANLIDAGVLIAKKTRYKPLIFGTAALSGLIFHLLLTTTFGLIGAAWATSLSLFVLFVVNYAVSQRFYRISLKRQNFVVIVVGGMVTYCVAGWLMGVRQSLVWELAVVAIAPLVFAAIFLSLGTYRWSDVRDLVSGIRLGKVS